MISVTAPVVCSMVVRSWVSPDLSQPLCNTKLYSNYQTKAYITNPSCRLPIVIQCYDVVALSKPVSMGTQSPYFGIPVSGQVLPENINIKANPFQSLIRVTCSVIRFDIDRLSNKNSTPNSHVTPPYRSVTFANPIQTRFPFSA